MTATSVAQALAGHLPEGGEVTVKGWVRTRRDSKAGLSFVNVSEVGQTGQLLHLCTG